MNPFNNRWVALLCVVGLLLVVAELVGTGENGGVLSQAAKSYAGAGEGHQAPEGSEESQPEVIPPPSSVIDEPPPPEDVPEEDMPQIIAAHQVDDTADLSVVDGPEMAEDPADDDPGFEDQ